MKPDPVKRAQIAETILRESEAMVKMMISSDNIQVLEAQIYELTNSRKPNEKVSVRLRVERVIKVHSDIEIHKKIRTYA